MIKRLKQLGLWQFGEIIPNLQINGQLAPYPVLNERVVRAGAGIMFLLGIIAFFNALLIQNYFFLKIVVVIFFVDFVVKVLITPKFSPISFVAGLIVSQQKPEYVGAVQKRFAWSLGLLLSFFMIILMFVLNIKGMINLSVCLVCLSFMWLESTCGICVGCKIYYGLIKLGVITEPKIRPACPGGICQVPLKK